MISVIVFLGVIFIVGAVVVEKVVLIFICQVFVWNADELDMVWSVNDRLSAVRACVFRFEPFFNAIWVKRVAALQFFEVGAFELFHAYRAAVCLPC